MPLCYGLKKSGNMQYNFQKYPFLQHYKKHRSQKFVVRCLACHYIQKGDSYATVSNVIKYSKQTVGKWVNMFKDGGIDRLLEIKKGRGRKSKISTSTKECFTQAVIELQKSRSGGRVIGEDIVAMIQEKYKHKYSVSGVYKVLKRMGLSWVSSRSIHPKTNIMAQEKFKENFLKSSKEQGACRSKY